MGGFTFCQPGTLHASSKTGGGLACEPIGSGLCRAVNILRIGFVGCPYVYPTGEGIVPFPEMSPTRGMLAKHSASVAKRIFEPFYTTKGISGLVSDFG